MSKNKTILIAALVLASAANAAAAVGTPQKAAAGKLGAYDPADICRALVATIKHEPVSGMRTDQTSSNLVVTYTTSKNGPTQNIKCHVDTEDGTAQWASDSGPWHMNQVKIGTNAHGALVIQPNQAASQTFTRAQLAEKSKGG